MSKKRILKIILMIIAVIIIIFMIHTVRNFVILKRMQKNIQPYTQSMNYHIKTVRTENSETKVTMDYYKKNEKQVLIMERNDKEQTIKMSMYSDGKKTNMYTDINGEKKSRLDVENLMDVNVVNYLDTENNLVILLNGITCTIRSKEYNAKKCYVINNLITDNMLSGTEENELYMEKETGLLLKTNDGRATVTREYEFDNINDEIFIEPEV